MSENTFQDPNAPKKPLIAEFFSEPVHLEHRSKIEGHPIYEDREFVRVIIPGNRGSIAVEPVNDENKARWPEQYKAFKEGRELPLEGTPLAHWPQVNRAQVEEFAYFHIRTVEHLAEINDSQLQKLPMGSRELRSRAKLFLDVAAKGTAPLSKLITENEQKTAQIALLQEQMADMAAQLRELTASKKGRAHAGA